MRSVHTFGMRFALDLVWLDGAGEVVRLDTDVRRRRVRTCLAARGGVVEVAAGSGAALLRALGYRAHPDGRRTGVAVGGKSNRDVPTGTLRAMRQQTGIKDLR